MSFCTVNGFNIPIEDRAAGRDLDLIGRPKRAITGTGEGSFFNGKRTFNLKTPVVENADFLAYQGLINGEGHVIPLQENSFTADGISPAADTAYPVFTATTNKFDGGDYYMTTSGGLLWSAADIGNTETTSFTLCWVTDASPSGHSIFAVTATDTSTGGADLVYRDGSPATLTAPFYNVQVYSLGLYVDTDFGTTEEKRIHEIVYLPFKLNATQMAAITSRTKRFSALPYIAVSGDMVDGESVTCTGTSGTSDFVPSSFSGTFGANNNLSFTIQEK
tara:strand:- start:565 stop:1392 length:828 start_codon:yes stop_codon:yes gene_type:complete